MNPPHREYLARKIAKLWPRFNTAEIAQTLSVPEWAVWNALNRAKEVRSAARRAA